MGLQSCIPSRCTQVRVNDVCLAILARSCPQLEELVIGTLAG